MNMNDAIKEDLFYTVWDIYKEVHGVRPRFLLESVASMTIEDLEEMVDSLSAQVDVQMQEDKVNEAKAIFSLENRISNMIQIGAGNRETAIRWLDAAEETNGDMNYLCYCLGVPYGYFNEITEKK